MIKIKKLLCLAVTLVVATTSFVSCDSKEKETTKKSYVNENGELSGEITFWHFNKDEGPVMAEMFMEKYPNVKVNVQIISDQDQGYQNKLTQAIVNGTGVPDVYCGESAFVKRFVNEEGGFDNLSDPEFNVEEVTKNMVPATVDIGRDDNGDIRALTYQVTPGAIAYKRELAKQYLGTDDTKEISEMISTPEKMLETARLLKEKSGGKVKFFAARQELARLYLGARSQGWVVDNKLVIDPMVDKYVDMAKKFREEGLEVGLEQWSQPWSASIAANDVLAYAVPTWGIPWIVESNDEARKDQGKWGLADSPIAYTWGGTWLGVYSGSKNKELAWEFVKFMVSNQDAMKEWSSKIGDFMNNTNIIDEYAAGTEINKTFNQNLYEVFKPSLNDINGKILTQYDDRIEAAFYDSMASYLAGEIDKDTMYKNFKEKVKSDFPDLIVK